MTRDISFPNWSNPDDVREMLNRWRKTGWLLGMRVPHPSEPTTAPTRPAAASAAAPLPSGTRPTQTGYGGA